MAWFFIQNLLSLLDDDLMANILEKAISILAENLNSGRSYLITAAVRWPKNSTSFKPELQFIFNICRMLDLKLGPGFDLTNE